MTPDKGLRSSECHLNELNETDPIRQVLHDLGSGLGRFDMESQLCGIDCAITRLEQIQRDAETEKRMRGRTYRTLGICAGLALAIVLV